MTSLAKDKEYIHFQKTSSDQIVELELPLKCRVYQSDQDKRFGRITSVQQTSILFEYKDYDTSEVNKIMAMDSLKRRERYDLIDTLIQHSKFTKEIPFEKVIKVSLLSRDDNTRRKLVMLFSSLGFMGSGIALMISTSSNVGQKISVWNWIEIAGMGTSAGLMASMMKRSFDMEKWKIVPPDR